MERKTPYSFPSSTMRSHQPQTNNNIYSPTQNKKKPKRARRNSPPLSSPAYLRRLGWHITAVVASVPLSGEASTVTSPSPPEHRHLGHRSTTTVVAAKTPAHQRRSHPPSAHQRCSRPASPPTARLSHGGALTPRKPLPTPSRVFAFLPPSHSLPFLFVLPFPSPSFLLTVAGAAPWLSLRRRSPISLSPLRFPSSRSSFPVLLRSFFSFSRP